MKTLKILAVALVAVPALAWAGSKSTEKGDGYRIESESPAMKSIKILEPRGARARITTQGPVVQAEDNIPFEFKPKVDGEHYIEIRLPNGEQWWTGSVKVKNRTEYRVFVDGPVDTGSVQTASATASNGQSSSSSQTVTASVSIGGMGMSASVTGPTEVVVANQSPPAPAYHQPAPPPPPGPLPMSEGDFAQFKAAIAAESFADDQFGVLETGARAAYFTVSQVGELVDIFDFSNDKVKVVERLRSRIVDAQNAYQLYGHFEFAADKDKVRRLFSAN